MTTISEVMPLLVNNFPAFRSRWEKHVSWWNGEPAGFYNDIAEFAHFIIESYASKDIGTVQRAFQQMERWLEDGTKEVQELVVIGFFEDLRNVASWEPFGSEVFIPFLGQKSSEAWHELERVWSGKHSLMDVLRSERKNRQR